MAIARFANGCCDFESAEHGEITVIIGKDMVLKKETVIHEKQIHKIYHIIAVHAGTVHDSTCGLL